MTAQQLKKSILQMAVQGKLVPQDPNDEPASVLLERIKAEKQELIKAGKIKKDKKSSEIFRGASRNIPYTFCEQIGKEIRDISDEIPFDIPESWEWCRLKSIVSILGDGIHGTPEYDDFGDYYFINGNNLENGKIVIKDNTKKINFLQFQKYKKELNDSTVLVSINGTIGNISFYKNEKVILGKSACYFNLIVNQFKNYIYNYLSTEYFLKYAKENATGSTIKNVSLQTMSDLLVPLPPLPEQNRIVTQIEKLIPYIEKYEQAETELTKLNNDFPELLKKSILQEAVQGKLVLQDPNDEPASVLLERIRAEKQALIKAGKIKKDKHESIIVTSDKIPYEIVDGKERCIAGEIPFELPDSWCWVRCFMIGSLIRGSGIKRTETVEKGFPCVRYGEIYTTYNISFTETKSYIPKELDEKCKHFNYGDIIFTLTGENKPDIAKAVAYIGDKPIAAGGDLAFWTHHKMNPLYLMYFLNSPYAIDKKVHLATGDIIVHISCDKIGSILLPVPPIEEQNRIVVKIEELIKYCEML